GTGAAPLGIDERQKRKRTVSRPSRAWRGRSEWANVGTGPTAHERPAHWQGGCGRALLPSGRGETPDPGGLVSGTSGSGSGTGGSRGPDCALSFRLDQRQRLVAGVGLRRRPSTSPTPEGGPLADSTTTGRGGSSDLPGLA